ncbi:TPA: hypothetical protein QCO67_005091 [Bacillus cereus]|nr:hypothetical protein [Bacillus cereus]HDR3914375.1 hypothetical protein [Bacillus cereus]HDV7172621.1 hypothetical protein [Bacillus cereus]
MPLNQQGSFLSNDYLAEGLIEKAPKRIPLSLIPFYAIRGKQLRYVRTPELVPAKMIEFGEAIPDQTTLPEEPVVIPLVEFATKFEYSLKTEDTCSDINNIFEIECAAAIRRIGYRICKELHSGSGGFQGFEQHISSANLIDLNGAPLTLEALDQAINKICTQNGEPGIIITNSVGQERMRKAHYDRHILPKEVNGHLVVGGWVTYINDMQPVCGIGPNMKTSIWFVQLGPEGLYGIVPEHVGENMFVIRQTPRVDQSQMSVQVTFPANLVLGSPGALSGITNIGVN